MDRVKIYLRPAVLPSGGYGSAAHDLDTMCPLRSGVLIDLDPGFSCNLVERLFGTPVTRGV